MTTETTTAGYLHTQKAPLCLILYGSALLCFVLGWVVGDTPGMYVAFVVGLVIALLTPAFHHLTVADEGDRQAIRFGPVPLLACCGSGPMMPRSWQGFWKVRSATKDSEARQS